MASAGRLTALQVRILGALAGLTPRWTLSGGGALAGVYTQHRTTRDLDLFYQACRALAHAPEDAKARLERVGLGVAVQQRAEAFCRFEVRDAGEMTLVDLVADRATAARSNPSSPTAWASPICRRPASTSEPWSQSWTLRASYENRFGGGRRTCSTRLAQRSRRATSSSTAATLTLATATSNWPRTSPAPLPPCWKGTEGASRAPSPARPASRRCWPRP